MELNDGTRVFGVIHISYNYEIDCKRVYRTTLFVLTSNAACRSQSSENVVLPAIGTRRPQARSIMELCSRLMGQDV